MNAGSLSSQRVAITGAGGYIGSRIAARLEAAGYSVVPLVRSPADASAGRTYTLQTPVESGLLEGIDTLIHCAWDMRVAKRDAVFATNVEGSRRLIEAAQQAGVGKLIFVSSMSAYRGCESNYGKAKLAVETLLGEHDNAVIIRPGLVYGAQPGGVVGAMLNIAKKTSVLPMVGTGDYRLYTCHEDDLLELVEHCVASPSAGQAEPLLAAHASGIPFREIVTRLADRKLTFVPVPWRLIWFALRGLEQLGIKSRLKSDSVIGLVKSDPAPDFSATARTPVSFRPLA